MPDRLGSPTIPAANKKACPGGHAFINRGGSGVRQNRPAEIDEAKVAATGKDPQGKGPRPLTSC